jgi:hypothetical protein
VYSNREKGKILGRLINMIVEQGPQAPNHKSSLRFYQGRLFSSADSVPGAVAPSHAEPKSPLGSSTLHFARR